MKRLLPLIGILFLVLLLPAAKGQNFSTDSVKTIGRVVAVVGNVPITDIDLQNEIDFFKRRVGVKKDHRNIESQVLDLLISRAIVDFVALQESITVSPQRVNDALEREIKVRDLASTPELCQRVEREVKISCSEYKSELRRQLKTQQVVQLRVNVPNPTPSQIEEWFKLNKG